MRCHEANQNEWMNGNTGYSHRIKDQEDEDHDGNNCINTLSNDDDDHHHDVQSHKSHQDTTCLGLLHVES